MKSSDDPLKVKYRVVQGRMLSSLTFQPEHSQRPWRVIDGSTTFNNWGKHEVPALEQTTRTWKDVSPMIVPIPDREVGLPRVPSLSSVCPTSI